MYTDAIPRSRQLTPRHSVMNQWDLARPSGDSAAGSGSRSGADARRRAGGRSRRQRMLAAVGVADQRTRWSSFTSARAHASSDGPRSHSCRARRRARSSRQLPARVPDVRTVRCARRTAHRAMLPERSLGLWRRAILESRPLQLTELRCAHRTRGALHWRRQRSAAHRRHHAGAHRRVTRPDAGRTVLSLAGSALVRRSRRARGAAVPAVSSANVRAGRLQVPDEHRSGARDCRGRARAAFDATAPVSSHAGCERT